MGIAVLSDCLRNIRNQQNAYYLISKLQYKLIYCIYPMQGTIIYKRQCFQEWSCRFGVRIWGCLWASSNLFLYTKMYEFV